MRGRIRLIKIPRVSEDEPINLTKPKLAWLSKPLVCADKPLLFRTVQSCAYYKLYADGDELETLYK